MSASPIEEIPRQGDAELADLLGEMVAGGRATAAVVVLAVGEGPLRVASAGWRRPPRSPERPEAPVEPGGVRALDPSDRFDLASLSKPIYAAMALRWAASALLPLDTRLAEIWPRVAPALAHVTLEDLLRHRAGFSRWTPLYARCANRREAADALLGGRLLGAELPGYSDLDYILWGLSVERALGEPLDRLVAREVGGLGPGAPLARPEAATAVECRMDGARESALAAELGVEVVPPAVPRPGQVQDGNARFLGGVAGHAGLFASASGIWRVVEEWMRPSGWLTVDGVDGALSNASGPFVLGWTRPSAWESVGGALPAHAYGHLGFTGGSVWFDRSAPSALVLLAHRSSPAADLGPWRHRLHERFTAGAGG
jgi:CubicO group peptidase (beta-lactamase class C family)